MTGKNDGSYIGNDFFLKNPDEFKCYSNIIYYGTKIKKINSGIGIDYISDIQPEGGTKFYGLGAYYAYHYKSGNDWNVSIGAKLNYTISRRSIYFYFPNVPILYYPPYFIYNNRNEALVPSKLRTNMFNASIGMDVRISQLYLGTVIDNLTKQSFAGFTGEEVYYKYFNLSYIGYDWLANNDFSWSSYIQYQYFDYYRDYKHQPLHVNIWKLQNSLTYKKISGSFTYWERFDRDYTGILLGVGYKFKKLNISYYYELMDHLSLDQTIGMHMLSLLYTFKNQN